MPVGLVAGANAGAGGVFANNVMLQQVRGFDWAATSAGAIESWPEELRGICRSTLLSSAPMSVLIGPCGLTLFNDAVARILGGRVDDKLGQPIGDILPFARDFHDRVLERSFSGRPSSFHDLALKVERGGGLEQAWFDLDFTPISDAHGNIQGTLVIINETTARVQALIDLQNSSERLDAALRTGGIVGTWEVDFATDTVHADERYARLHGVDPAIARAGAHKEIFIRGIHPDDLEQTMEAFERAKTHGAYHCQHRVIGFEGTRWIVASGFIRRKPDGTPATFTGTAVDVTDQVNTAAALLASEKRFRTYTEALPHIVFGWDAEGRPTYANRRWYEWTGRSADQPGALEWHGIIHPEDAPQMIKAFEDAIATSTRLEAITRMLDHQGQWRWVHGIALPMRDDADNVTGWIGTLSDVHTARLLETERELVSKELDHRIKNFFAVAQGLITLTQRENLEVETFAERLKGRLATLHRSHNFIRQGQNAAGGAAGLSLHELLRQLLEPYEVTGAERRFIIEGDDAPVGPGKVTGFALVFHELATNAAKYGALASPDGQVTFRSDVLPAGETHMVWKEAGAKSSPGKGLDGGFGSRLISLVIESQFRGSFERTVDDSGVRVDIHLPPDPPAR